MNKMNKKGFTLIEMLVVIAIIAVLVAIIIPTVSNSTGKAAAATNAANLRSVYAELQTDILAGVDDNQGYVSIVFDDDGDYTITLNSNCPKAAKVDTIAKNTEMTYDADAGVVVYGGKTVNDFATYAELGAWS